MKKELHFDKTDLIFLFAVLLFALLLISLQTTVFTSVRLFGGIPDLLLACTVSLGLLCGEKYGAGFGIFAGILRFAVGSETITVYPLFYMLCGYLGPICERWLPTDSRLSRIAVCATACISDMFAVLIGAVFRIGEFSLSTFFIKEMLPAFFATVTAFPFVYFSIYFICRIGYKHKNHNV